MIGFRTFDTEEPVHNAAGEITLVGRTSTFRVGSGRMAIVYEYRRPVAVAIPGQEPGAVPIRDVTMWARVALALLLAIVLLTGGDR